MAGFLALLFPYLPDMNRRKTVVLLLLFGAFGQAVSAQLSKDSIVKRQNALVDDYVGRIKAMGFSPSLARPALIVDNPRSWGNYDDSANTIETCDWSTLPAEQKAVFTAFADSKGGGMT